MKHYNSENCMNKKPSKKSGKKSKNYQNKELKLINSLCTS